MAMIKAVINMDYITKKISNWLLKENYITDDQADDIIYALEIVISNILPFSTILILGVVFQQLTKTVLFFLVFVGFRILRDRYHAPTFLKCYILTVGSFISCLVMSLIINLEDQLLFTFYMVILNILLFVVFKIKIDEGQNQKSNFIYNFILITYNSLCLILSKFVLHEYTVFLSVLGLIIVSTSIAKEKSN